MMEPFQTDYSKARKALLEVYSESGAKLTSHCLSHLGPHGETLATDVVCMGSINAPKKLLVISGTHGVEGFAGSAIQITTMVEWRKRLPVDMAIVLIHALNPYGFAWIRRVNEDNVDLNRNFVDHSLPYPENRAYTHLAAAICPLGWTKEHRHHADQTILDFVRQQGQQAFQALVSLGQYQHPDGLMFGGNQAVWSNRILQDLVAPYIPNTQHVVIVDIHTGLGPFGQGELISCAPKTSLPYQWGRNMFGSITSVVEGDAVSPLVEGEMTSALENMFRPYAQNITALVLEFGTHSTLKVFHALRAENWHYFHGDLHDGLDSPFKQKLKEAFCPDSTPWRLMVLKRGMEVIEQAIQGLET